MVLLTCYQASTAHPPSRKQYTYRGYISQLAVSSSSRGSIKNYPAPHSSLSVVALKATISGRSLHLSQNDGVWSPELTDIDLFVNFGEGSSSSYSLLVGIYDLQWRTERLMWPGYPVEVTRDWSINLLLASGIINLILLGRHPPKVVDFFIEGLVPHLPWGLS